MLSKEILGFRIRSLRNENGLSMEKLGKEFGVTKQTISHWEIGERLLALDIAYALADYFGVSLDYLTGRSDVR